MMKNLYLSSIASIIVIICSVNNVAGQAVSINSTGTAPDAQSILDISSANKGVLLPRLTNHTDVTPTGSSDFGLTVYDLTTKSYWYWDGLAWQEIPNMGSIPTVSLDDAYNGGTFITADAGAVDIQGAGGLLVNGITGIGTSTPDAAYQLSVLNGNNSVKVAGSSVGVRVEVQAVGEDGIYVSHTSTGNSQTYYAIRGSLASPSTDGYLGYHTTAGGGAQYAVYGTGGDYAGYFDGDVNLTGELQINGSAGTSGQVLVSQGSGSDPIWGAAGVQSVTAGSALTNSGTATAPILDVEANNGLNVDVPNNKVQLGGPLTEGTTITQGAFDLTYNLSGTGDFIIQDGGTNHFEINDNDGNAFFGGDLTFGDGSTAGTILMDVTDAGVGGNDGRLRIYSDGAVNHLIQGDGDVIFNELGNDRNFRIESDNQVNMLFLDAGLDRIGLGTATPTQMFDVNGSIRMRGGTTTSGWIPVSSGDGTMVWTDPALLGADITTASNGLTEVVNDIQLGGTLTQNTTVAQGAFTLDFTSTAVDGFSIDGTTFSVDAANNRIGIGTATPSYPLHVYNTADDIAMIQGADHSRLYIDGTDVSEKALIFSEAGTEQWKVGMDNANGTGGSTNDFIVKQTNDGSPEFMVQASSGNVGIGTNTPDANLNVGAASGATLYLTREDNTTLANNVLGSLLFDSTDDTSPSTTDASAGIRAYASQDHGNSNKGGYMTFFTKNNTSNATAASERMRIQADGNVAIGATSASVKLYVAGDATITGKFNSNGIQESSDVRFKKNIKPLENVLEKLLQLEGVTYNWRQDEFPKRKFGSQMEIGVIAQEVEKIYPELVSTDADGYKAVQYSHMVPLLLEAIKEQQKQIELLTKMAEDSEARYSDLKIYLGEIENRNK